MGGYLEKEGVGVLGSVGAGEALEYASARGEAGAL